MGYKAGVVERWIQAIHQRVDLFGCIDIVAVREHVQGVLGVQSTTADNESKRVTKAAALPTLRTWLEAGNFFEVHGWALKGARGKRKIWALNIIPIFLRDGELVIGEIQEGKLE
jgi:hypothetical protein